MGDLKLSSPRRQRFGERQRAHVGIESAHGAAIAAHRRQSHFDVVLVAQIACERSIRVGAIDHQLVRRRLELGEVIHIVLDHIRHFFRRKVRRVESEEVAAVVELGGESACRFDGRAIRVIERDDRARGRGILGELAKIGCVERVFFEERIAEDFLQVAGESR